MIRTAFALGAGAALLTLIPDVTTRLLFCLPLLAAPFALWLLAGPQRWLVAFFVAGWLLPPLPIPIGNSGPHVALLFAAAGSWLALLRLTKWRLTFDAVSVALLSLYAAICLSLGMAILYSGAAVAVASFARVVLFGITLFVFFYVRDGISVAPVRTLVRVLFSTAVLSALLACLDFYFQFPAPAGYGPQFVWLDSGVFRRAQGVFYEASTLGNFCAFFLVMIVAALPLERGQRMIPLWAMLGGGAVLAAALILSYSRASLITVLVAAAVLVWLHRSRVRFARLLPAVGGAAAAGIAALFWLLPNFLYAYWARIVASAQFFAESPNGVLSGRVQSWTFLVDFLLANPWHALLGVGYKTLPYSDFVGTATVADNTYLSMLIETGIGGLVALVALNVAILRVSYRAARSLDIQRSFLGTWMLCFWAGESIQMLSGDILTYWRVVPAYFCVLALASKA